MGGNDLHLMKHMQDYLPEERKTVGGRIEDVRNQLQELRMTTRPGWHETRYKINNLFDLSMWMVLDCSAHDFLKIADQFDVLIQMILKWSKELDGLEIGRMDITFEYVQVCQVMLCLKDPLSYIFPMTHIVRNIMGLMRHCLNYDEVDSFLDFCFSHGKYDCLALVAVCYDYDLQELPFLETLTAASLTEPIWSSLVNYLIAERRLSCLKILLRQSTHPNSRSVFPLITEPPVDHWRLAVFQLLLDRSESDLPWLREMFDWVVERSKDELFEIMVYSEKPTIRRMIQEFSLHNDWLSRMVIKRCQRRHGLLPEMKVEACLSVACEAGLLSLLHARPYGSGNAMEKAITHHDTQLVKFLHTAGAGEVTKNELNRITKEMLEREQRNTVSVGVNQKGIKEKEADKEIHDFLTQKASQPLSLQSLCLQEVSRQVGWGHAKKVNVDHLPVPEVFKTQLWLKDVRALLAPEDK